MLGSKKKVKPGKLVITIVPVQGKLKKHKAVDVPPEGLTLRAVLAQLNVPTTKQNFVRAGTVLKLDELLTVAAGQRETIELHERPEGS